MRRSWSARATRLWALCRRVSVFRPRRSMPFWTPLVLSRRGGGQQPGLVFPVARLKKGVTRDRADANLGVLAGRLRQIAPKAKVEAGQVRRHAAFGPDGGRPSPVAIAAARGGGIRAADRLRQRRQPVPGPRDRAAAGDGACGRPWAPRAAGSCGRCSPRASCSVWLPVFWACC